MVNCDEFKPTEDNSKYNTSRGRNKFLYCNKYCPTGDYYIKFNIDNVQISNGPGDLTHCKECSSLSLNSEKYDEYINQCASPSEPGKNWKQNQKDYYNSLNVSSKGEKSENYLTGEKWSYGSYLEDTTNINDNNIGVNTGFCNIQRDRKDPFSDYDANPSLKRKLMIGCQIHKYYEDTDFPVSDHLLKKRFPTRRNDITQLRKDINSRYGGNVKIDPEIVGLVVT